MFPLSELYVLCVIFNTKARHSTEADGTVILLVYSIIVTYSTTYQSHTH